MPNIQNEADMHLFIGILVIFAILVVATRGEILDKIVKKGVGCIIELVIMAIAIWVLIEMGSK